MKEETNFINIVVAWLYVIIGIIGLWAFYNYNHSAQIICGLLCAVQLLVATFTKQLQTYNTLVSDGIPVSYQETFFTYTVKPTDEELESSKIYYHNYYDDNGKL